MPIAQADTKRLGTLNGVVKILYVNIIVAGGMHFGKMQHMPRGAHMIDVDKLGVVLAVPAGNNIRKRVRTEWKAAAPGGATQYNRPSYRRAQRPYIRYN